MIKLDLVVSYVRRWNFFHMLANYSEVMYVGCMCLGNVGARGVGAADTVYRTMYTVEELYRNKRGKYSDDTRLEIVPVLIESKFMERDIARYKHDYVVLLHHERLHGVPQ